MGIGNAAEILKSELVALLHSISFGIHATKRPGGQDIAVASSALQQFPCGFNITELPRGERSPQVGGAVAERSQSLFKGFQNATLGRDSADRRSDIGGASSAIKGVGLGRREAEPDTQPTKNVHMISLG
jgi:hypothetical protein